MTTVSPDPAREPTVPGVPASAGSGAPGPDGGPRLVRLFGSPSFFRLWLAQVVSSTGDWTGLVAILALTARIGKSSPEAAVGLVMSARMIPGLFLASVGGVLVDRLDRKRVMVSCDIGRGLVLATLPFVHSVWGLFGASLLLEIMTLLWTPAKEASVPNLVRQDQLTTANSLSLAAAYGTFPVGSLLFATLAGVAEWLGHWDALHVLKLNQESLAIYADVLTFFTSAMLIATLALPRRSTADRERRIDLGQTFAELKDGWRFIGTSPIVRSVLIGLSTGLLGGGIVVPLGPVFAKQVVRAGPAGFGLLMTALGSGVAIGVVALSVLQRRLPHQRIFLWSLAGAGSFLLAAASMASLGPAAACIVGMGVCTGAAYVLGFTLLQESVDDQLRGRIFAALYAMVRLCLLLSLAVAPLVASLADRASRHWLDAELRVGGWSVSLPGARITLWLGGLVILGAWWLASRALRDERQVEMAASTAAAAR